MAFPPHRCLAPLAPTIPPPQGRGAAIAVSRAQTAPTARYGALTGERSRHPAFVVGFGGTLAAVDHDRAIGRGGLLGPVILPVAGLAGAHHARFLRVGVALPVELLDRAGRPGQ